MVTIAKKQANSRYQKNTPMVTIHYNKQEIEEYEKIKIHCSKINMTIQAYLKMLAREDMKHWS